MTDHDTNDEIARHALELANGMEALCQGRPYAAVLTAFAMMLAESEARRPDPNIDDMVERFGRWVHASFNAAMARREIAGALDEPDGSERGLLQ